jgi:hypothetical protein
MTAGTSAASSNSAPGDTPWFWTIAFFSRRGAGPHQGYGAIGEEAMAGFKSEWGA